MPKKEKTETTAIHPHDAAAEGAGGRAGAPRTPRRVEGNAPYQVLKSPQLKGEAWSSIN